MFSRFAMDFVRLLGDGPGVARLHNLPGCQHSPVSPALLIDVAVILHNVFVLLPVASEATRTTVV